MLNNTPSNDEYSGFAGSTLILAILEESKGPQVCKPLSKYLPGPFIEVTELGIVIVFRRLVSEKAPELMIFTPNIVIEVILLPLNASTPTSLALELKRMSPEQSRPFPATPFIIV